MNQQIAALGKVCLKGERVSGSGSSSLPRKVAWPVTSRILRQPALAPALAVKIDAAYRRYFLKGCCCLASGGISRWSKLIMLYNCSRRRTLGLELVGGGVYGRKGFGKVQVEDMAVRRTFRLPQYSK